MGLRVSLAVSSRHSPMGDEAICDPPPRGPVLEQDSVGSLVALSQESFDDVALPTYYCIYAVRRSG